MSTDYQSMSVASLMDLLASHTEKYTHLLADKRFGDEYDQTKHAIRQIQAAIEARKTFNSTDQDISFTSTDSTIQ